MAEVTTGRVYEEIVQRLVKLAQLNSVTVSGSTITGRNFSITIPRATSETINQRTSRRR